MSNESSTLLRSFTDTRLRSKQLKDSLASAIVDGSKIIFRLRKHDKIAFDNAAKIILATPKIKIEHNLPWHQQITCSEDQNLIIIDASSPGQRFYPMPMKQYGTVYTRPGTIHVATGDIRRSKVSCRNLPYKTCNKFENASGEPLKTAEADSLDKEGCDSFLYLRSDESIIRYRLAKNERVELHSGRIVAWTLGVHFEFKTWCCIRFVSAVSGEGTIWVHNWRNTNTAETDMF